MEDTIVAIATAPIKSALAIVRVSGDDSLNVVSNIFSKDLRNVTSTTVFVGSIQTNEEQVDEVVLIAYKAPHSFTGEDSVEIICHGSILIANKILELLIKHGARLAANGEYSSRAFLNNKIDLVQAEAINDTINATTKEAQSLSMKALTGEASDLLSPIDESLAALLANIEASIDYPEETDIEVATKEEIIKICKENDAKIASLVISGKQGRIIKDGIKLAIVGKPNVGKSSLLNALIKQDKAIVTDIPGTTRDLVEGDFSYKGIVYHAIDTAGLHDAIDKIERIGIDKTMECASNSDVVAVILNEGDSIEEFSNLIKNKKYLIVYNKSDLLTKKDSNRIYISALKKDINSFLEALNALVGVSNDVFNHASLCNSRQIGLLEKARINLQEALRDAENNATLDILFVNIMAAYQNLNEILHGGGTIVDLDKEIFSRFCVGK